MLKADSKRNVAILEDVPLRMPIYQYWAKDGYWVWAIDGERVILASRRITLTPQMKTRGMEGYYPTPPPVLY